MCCVFFQTTWFPILNFCIMQSQSYYSAISALLLNNSIGVSNTCWSLAVRSCECFSLIFNSHLETSRYKPFHTATFWKLLTELIRLKCLPELDTDYNRFPALKLKWRKDIDPNFCDLKSMWPSSLSFSISNHCSTFMTPLDLL